jgi:signal transduction histidine kinase
MSVFIITAITIITINGKIKRRNLNMKIKLENEIRKNTKEIKESNIKLEKLNKQLRINDRLQKDFINIASHELRTPAQAITGYTEMALEDETYKNIDSKHGQFINIIHRNAIRLQSLIENILDVSKIDNNSLQLNLENVNIIKEIQ